MGVCLLRGPRVNVEALPVAPNTAGGAPMQFAPSDIVPKARVVQPVPETLRLSLAAPSESVTAPGNRKAGNGVLAGKDHPVPFLSRGWSACRRLGEGPVSPLTGPSRRRHFSLVYEIGPRAEINR